MEHTFPLLAKLGLAADSLPHGPASLEIGDENPVLSTRHYRDSALPPLQVTLTRLDQLADLLELAGGPDVAADNDLDASEQNLAWEDVGAETVTKLRDGLFRHIAGQKNLPQGLTTEMERHFFPMPVSVYAARDIYVKSGATFVIGKGDHDPQVCDFGTVTLEEGGRILIVAPAIINIETFKKIPAV